MCPESSETRGHQAQPRVAKCREVSGATGWAHGELLVDKRRGSPPAMHPPAAMGGTHLILVGATSK